MAKFVQFHWLGGGAKAREASQLTFHARGPWQPAMNAYRCEDGIRVCFDLAGVDRSQIAIEIEPGRLVVHGVRQAPEPAPGEPCPKQILCMEIDHGPFRRELRLPPGVAHGEATAEQRDGLLWIHLPLSHG